MKIGEAAAASGVSARLIRHYESIGILPRASRSPGGYRAYTILDVKNLSFVSYARSLGFPLKDIKKLMGLLRNQKRACKDVKKLALSHLHNLEAKIQELGIMAETLQALVEKCHDDDQPECPILDALTSGNTKRTKQ
jgi:MerR family gold-responsive transcriptional activator of gol and ges genes